MLSKKIISLSMLLFTATSFADSSVTLPEKQITYTCHCQSPVSPNICTLFDKGEKRKASDPAVPVPSTLANGWIVQPVNCANNQQYTLTAGAVYFSGNPVFAVYESAKATFVKSGYVYHVTPNLPNTQSNDSLTLVSHPAISGINLSEKNQWQCGFGNGARSCHQKFNVARCFTRENCDFLYSQKIKNK